MFRLRSGTSPDLPLVACTNQTSQQSQPGSEASGIPTQSAEAATYKVAIIKQTNHPSLDEIANAVAARLEAIDRSRM